MCGPVLKLRVRSEEEVVNGSIIIVIIIGRGGGHLNHSQ